MFYHFQEENIKHYLNPASQMSQTFSTSGTWQFYITVYLISLGFGQQKQENWRRWLGILEIVLGIFHYYLTFLR